MAQNFRARIVRAFKTYLGRAVFALGLNRAILGRTAVVVAFHRVERDFPNNGMNMPPDVFRGWCRYFARHFRVVPAGKIARLLKDGQRLDGELAITFDDGYLDFAAQAVPVLESLGLPATVFAVSDFVGSDTVPWWDRRDGVSRPFMSWDELRGVAAKGFTVGSHGKSHRGMDQLTPDEALLELTESKRVLEDGLGREVGLYAYPYGEPERMPDTARDLVGLAGYSACFGYGGLVESGDNPLNIGRICVNDWFSCPDHFGGHLVVLALKSRARRLLGRS